MPWLRGREDEPLQLPARVGTSEVVEELVSPEWLSKGGVARGMILLELEEMESSRLVNLRESA